MYKKIVAKNKAVSFNYFIEEEFEAGIVLYGSEVKAIREGKITIVDSHATRSGSEIYLYNCNISHYKQSTYSNHEPNRPKKLLLNRREIKKIIGKITIKGYSLVVKSVYLNHKNLIKVELALGRGKKLHDKRHSIKERDWNRQKDRFVRKDY